jgi:hypothetical protein
MLNKITDNLLIYSILMAPIEYEHLIKVPSPTSKQFNKITNLDEEQQKSIQRLYKLI